MLETSRLVTADELARQPEDDFRYELIAGRVVRMSPVAHEHGYLVAKLIAVLHPYVTRRLLGAVATEVGFTLASNPDTVRAPDVSFVTQARRPPRRSKGFVKGPPDLAIEVVSPDDTPSELRGKVDEYLQYGVRLVIVVDPDPMTVTVHRRLAPPVTLDDPDDVLDLGDVIPDFHCTLREIFD